MGLGNEKIFVCMIILLLKIKTLIMNLHFILYYISYQPNIRNTIGKDSMIVRIEGQKEI